MSIILPRLVQLCLLGLSGLLGTAVISSWVYFISIRYGATLRRRAGYTLGFATRF